MSDLSEIKPLVERAIGGMNSRLLELEQKLARRPGGGFPGSGGDGSAASELAGLITENANTKALLEGATPTTSFKVPSRLLKAAILGSSTLVAPDRQPGIAAVPARRLLVRDLFPAVPTGSNMVEFTRELTFTNAAAPQGSASSPSGQYEGQPKAESAITFELVQQAVSTIAHWVPASRQVLSDAPQLAQFVEQRLAYGLQLEIEREVLVGTNVQGELNGLITVATAFNGGATNQSALDTISKAIGQLIAADYSPTGIVLNPRDWHGSSFQLAKSTVGEYLFGSPGAMTAPSLWGIPVIVTASMTAGSFLVLDAPRAGFVATREEAVVRISEHTNDDFIRNLVRILVEERLALCIVQSAAIITGSLSFAG